MSRKNLIELVLAVAATAVVWGGASASTPQPTVDTRQEAAKELGITRNAWAQCVRAAIPRLDHPQSSSDVASSDAVARAAMKSCSGEYADMVRALRRTLAPSCGRDPDCTRAALATARRQAKRLATNDVVNARVRAAGAAAVQCQ